MHQTHVSNRNSKGHNEAQYNRIKRVEEGIPISEVGVLEQLLLEGGVSWEAEVATSGLLGLIGVVSDLEQGGGGEPAADGVCGHAGELLVTLIGALLHTHPSVLHMRENYTM